MLKINENSVAVWLSILQRTFADIVEPLLLIPGKTAKPCTIPTTTEFVYVILFFGLYVFVFVLKCTSINNIAVIIKQILKYPPENELSKKLLNKITTTTVGIVATTTKSVFLENGFLLDPKFVCNIK